MPLRNFFGRRTAATTVHDENLPPEEDPSTPGFERVDTVGSKTSSVMSIRSGQSVDTGAYELSVVNDSGVYLPPSPTEDASEKGLWSRRYLSSRTSSDAYSSVGEIEHFSISRESFDSYRRSFDISAKAPVATFDVPARQSLDSARFARPHHNHRYPLGGRFARTEPTTEEDDFEDVGLDGAADAANKPRRKFFAMFESQQQDSEVAAAPGTTAPGATGGSGSNGGGVSRFLPGWKRGQNSTGAELRPMGPPTMSPGAELVQVTH